MYCAVPVHVCVYVCVYLLLLCSPYACVCVCARTHSPQHLPQGFPLPNLLPLLSLILHLLELHILPHAHHNNLVPSSVVPNIHPLQLLSAVLKAMESMHKLVCVYTHMHMHMQALHFILVFLRLCLDGKRSNGEKYAVSEDLTTFLFISFEETIVPALLVSHTHNTASKYIYTTNSIQLKAEELDRTEPFAAFFSTTIIQLEGLTESPNTSLAIKLGSYITSCM